MPRSMHYGSMAGNRRFEIALLAGKARPRAIVASVPTRDARGSSEPASHLGWQALGGPTFRADQLERLSSLRLFLSRSSHQFFLADVGSGFVAYPDAAIARQRVDELH